MEALWIKREGGEMVCSAEPFEGAVRFVAQGKPWTQKAEDIKLVAAFDAGASAEFLSDNPHPENSSFWHAWRAGYDWQRTPSAEGLAA